MIRIEYDSKSAGTRFSFIATDGAVSTLPVALKELCDMGNFDDWRLWIKQNSDTLTILKDALEHCIEAEKKNEEHRRKNDQTQL